MYRALFACRCFSLCHHFTLTLLLISSRKYSIFREQSLSGIDSRMWPAAMKHWRVLWHFATFASSQTSLKLNQRWTVALLCCPLPPGCSCACVCVWVCVAFYSELINMLLLCVTKNDQFYPLPFVLFFFIHVWERKGVITVRQPVTLFAVCHVAFFGCQLSRPGSAVHADSSKSDTHLLEIKAFSGSKLVWHERAKQYGPPF